MAPLSLLGVDALVWALNDLLLARRPRPGIISY
jgi:hypothetical protein